jgi:preprotein translocase subunit SecE
MSEPQKTVLDTVKWIVVWSILTAAVIVNYSYANVPMSIRLIGWLLLSLLVLGIIFRTQKGKIWWGFFEASKSELKKIVWPSRQETIQTTVVVVLTVIIASLFLWGVDAILAQAIQFLTENKG